MNKEEIEKFYQLETRLHKKDVRNSSEAVAELLADNFIEFGSSGKIYNKEVTIEALKIEQEDQEIEVSDFLAECLSEDVVLVTYKATKKYEQSRILTLRSSIWKLVGNKWQMVFHQGTKVQ